MLDRHLIRAFLWLALFCGFPLQAQAQSPAYRNLDTNGVDLTLGDFVMSFPEGSIGSGQGALTLIRQYNSTSPSQWDGYAFSISTTGSTTTVFITQAGRYADTFTEASGATTFTAKKQNGATLTGSVDSYVYQAANGTKVAFTNAYGNDGIATNICGTGGVGTNCSLQATSITSPNGAVVNLGYAFRTTSTNFFVWRISSISNNFGYSIAFAYQGLGGASPLTQWQTRKTAKFFNNNVSTTISQGTVNYAYPAADTTDITDMAGNVWEVTSTSIKRPSESSPSFSIGGSIAAVTSATRDGVTTNYARTVSGTTATMTVTDAASNSAVVTSDLGVGRPTSTTNALGKTTSYTYDSFGRRTRVTAPEGNYTNYTYDTRGNVTETRSVAKSGSGLADLVATAAYPASCTNPITCNQPTSTNDVAGNTTDYTYDSTTGLPLTVTAPAPTTGAKRPQTRYSYTASSGITLLTGVSSCASGDTASPTCVGTASETKTTIAYDGNFLPNSVTVAAGDGSLTATTTTTYNPLGDVLSVDGPLSGTADTTTYRYDAARRQVGVISPDPDGAGALKRRASRTTYDSAGRAIEVETGTVTGTADADWAAFSTYQQANVVYANGRKVSDSLTAGGTTYAVRQYSYDVAGRLDCSAVRMNPTVWGSLPASACTAQTSGSAGPDRIAKNTYDVLSRATKVTSAYGTADASDDVTTTYTDNGNAAAVTDANGNKTSYSYDGFDRLTKTQFPSPTTPGTSSTTDYEQSVYDAYGHLTSRRLRGYAADSTQHIDYTYDSLNRLTLKDLPGSEPDVIYTYDNLGRTTGASQTGNALSFTFDALGREVSETGPLGAMTTQYDAGGRVSRVTWPDSFYVTYDYLVTGEVTNVRENGAASGIGVLGTYTYDDLGRLTTLVRGNSTSTTFGFDAVSRLASMTADLSGTAQDQSLAFTYNPANQIASTTRSNDAYAWTGAYNVNRPYSANGLNQLTMAGSVALGYDARGNLTSSGASAYTYSSENLLKTAPSSASLTYDPLLRLYQTAATGYTTTRFGYSGSTLTGEYDASGALLRRYVYGASTMPLVWYEGVGTTDRRWLHTDERGSVIAVSNASGASLGTNSYDEYGIPAAGNIGRFQYTGQAWLAELGMYYFKARIYSPTLGRFMQTDPIGYGDGPNWYNYVHGDPINGTDPNGTCTGSRIPGNCVGPVTCYGNCGFDNSPTIDRANKLMQQTDDGGIGEDYSLGKKSMLQDPGQTNLSPNENSNDIIIDGRRFQVNYFDFTDFNGASIGITINQVRVRGDGELPDAIFTKGLFFGISPSDRVAIIKTYQFPDIASDSLLQDILGSYGSVDVIEKGSSGNVLTRYTAFTQSTVTKFNYMNLIPGGASLLILRNPSTRGDVYVAVETRQ